MLAMFTVGEKGSQDCDVEGDKSCTSPPPFSDSIYMAEANSRKEMLLCVASER